MIRGFLILALFLVAGANECCVYDDYWSCPEDETCSCSPFTGACLFNITSCYIYATCGCCIESFDQQYNGYCPHCSCSSFTGACYETSMESYCFQYTPCSEEGCCLNMVEFEFNNPFQNFSCAASTGTCKMQTEYGCWVYVPCKDVGCCLIAEGNSPSSTNSCSNFTGATNYTLENSDDDTTCWIFAPSLVPTTGCGCKNVTGNCTCESSSVSCNTTFFDGSWGILPPGANVTYSWYPLGVTTAITETYACSIDYTPPSLLVTILAIAITSAIVIFFINCCYKFPFLQEDSVFKKVYKFASIVNMFWPSVHLAVTMGYLFYLLDNQPFVALLAYPSTNSTDYVLVNSNWYYDNQVGLDLQSDLTVINGQNCFVITNSDGSTDDQSPFLFLGYVGIVLFLLVSIVHTGHTLIFPDSKKTNYFIYCLAVAFNLLTAGWTWTAWDYCYSFLPVYNDGLFGLYKGLLYTGYTVIGLYILAWGSLCFGCNLNMTCVTLILGCVLALVGFVYKILTYLQLFLRYYPKLLIFLDFFYHIHIFGAFCLSKIK